MACYPYHRHLRAGPTEEERRKVREAALLLTEMSGPFTAVELHRFMGSELPKNHLSGNPVPSLSWMLTRLVSEGVLARKKSRTITVYFIPPAAAPCAPAAPFEPVAAAPAPFIKPIDKKYLMAGRARPARLSGGRP